MHALQNHEVQFDVAFEYFDRKTTNSTPLTPDNIRIHPNALYASIPKINYLCAVFQHGEPVSNNENRQIMTEAFDSLYKRLFSLVIKSAGGFIEDDDVGLFVKPCMTRLRKPYSARVPEVMIQIFS